MKKHGQHRSGSTTASIDKGTDSASERLREDDEELEQRQAEALREWRNRPADRQEFSRDNGQTEHKDWQNEKRRNESARGRKEGVDFAIEYTLPHPDGSRVRYDYVDFRSHHIIDRKPARDGEKELDIARRYLDQQRRYIEAYRAKFGVEPTFEYSLYSSTQNMAGKKIDTPSPKR